MSLPFNPSFIYTKATNVAGFSELRSAMEGRCYFGDALRNALTNLIDEYSDWDSEQGFGSSDTTYAVKSLIDYLIGEAYLVRQFDTKFTPCLSIVKL